MEKMTKDEMILFLKGMNHRVKTLEEEKRRLIGSVEAVFLPWIDFRGY